MKVIGITGGIATGKSALTGMFAERGAAVFNADVCVHQLLDRDPDLYKQIAWTFPNAIEDRRINRKLLGDVVFADETKLSKLETILHPYVREQEIVFIKNSLQEGKALVAMDIPLLIESGADKLCDVVILTECASDIQKQRALARPGMTSEKLAGILRRQMKQEERLKKATHVVRTDVPIEQTSRQIDAIIKVIQS